MSAIAKWTAEARRRGAAGLVRVSGGLTLAAAAALLSLPSLPLIAARWGPPSPPPALPASAASLAPAAVGVTGAEASPIEIVKTRPLAVERAAPPELSPTAAERAQLDAAAAQQRAGFKAKKPAEKAPAGEAQPPSSVAPPPGTPSPAEGATPATEPERWSDAEVATALKTCVQIIGPTGAIVETLGPIRQDKCGTPAPVALKRVGTNSLSVELAPPAVLNCAMVAKISDWVEKVLQPAAREMFGASVIRMNSTSGYVCRGRNGDTLPSGKISEHALANALDVASFTLSDGRTIDVGKHWGPTRRDRQTRAPVPGAKAEPPSAPASPVAKPRRGAAQAAVPEPAKAPAQAEASTQEGQFLRRLHDGACAHFGTALGPEANDAHREHFHFDLHPRKHASYCQ